MITKVKWEDADFDWTVAPTNQTDPRYTWDLVQIIEEVIEDVEKGGRSRYHEEKAKWDKKKKKVIKLVMYRKNIKVYDEKKEVKNIKHHIKDIKLIAEELKKNVQIIHG